MIQIFKSILKTEDVKAKTFAKKIGLKYTSYRALISQNSVPRWVKSFIFGYSLGRKSTKVEQIEVVDPETVTWCKKCGMETFLINTIGCRDENCPEENFEI